MKEQLTRSDKIRYLKQKLDDPTTPISEKLEILEFMLHLFTSPEFDIEEFFGSKVSAKPGFGNNIISEAKSRLGCDHRVTPMGNVGKWTSVN